MIDDLKERIRSHYINVTQQEFMTIGVEQEFFLLSAKGMPASHTESQLFLQNLAGFGKKKWATDAWFGNYIESVSNERGDFIKYDHHPHLLEIATCASRQLKDIERSLQLCLEVIKDTSERLGLRLSMDPILELPTDDSRTQSELAFCRHLRAYRKKLFELRQQPVDDRLINYAAGILATQIHVGGIALGQYNELIPQLYAEERTILAKFLPMVSSHLPVEEVLRYRQRVYEQTFLSSPLWGEPTFDWSVEAWLDALMDTPLFGTEEDLFAGYTLRQMPTYAYFSTEELLYRVRDLQWIKPHRQGTIEFRAMPALCDWEAIVYLCEKRIQLIRELQ